MLTALRHNAKPMFTSACRLATGRSAIYHMIQRSKADCAVLPCYVPEGVFKPIMQAGLPIAYYKLKPDLTPDLDDLDMWLGKLNDGGGVRPLIVVIHYFGMPTPMAPIRVIADGRRGIMFEDCAHALVGEASHAMHADVALYSFNKFLPVPDGAVMVSRNRKIDLSIDESTLPELPAEAIDAYMAHLSFNSGIVYRTGNDPQVGALIDGSDAAYERYYEFIKNDMTPRRQSAMSRAIELTFNKNLMHGKRLANSWALAARLPKRFLVRNVEAPFAFPIYCHGQRERIATALYNCDIIAAQQVAKWNHARDYYKVETRFLDDHLLLPVGEDVTNAHLDIMVKVIGGFA